ELHRVGGLVVSFGWRPEMQRERKHARVLSRTIVLQHVWLFASFAKFARDLGAVGLVHATLQRLRAQPDLREHRGGQLSVNRLAIVRSAGKGNFFFSKAKAIS